MATCPKCQLPNPDTAGACIWCGQHRFETEVSRAEAPPAGAAPRAEGVLSETSPGQALVVPVMAQPQPSSPLVASFLTPTTPAPEHKPLPSHVGLLFAQPGTAGNSPAPPTIAEKASAPAPSRPAPTQAGIPLAPNPGSTATITATTSPQPQFQPKLVVLRGQRINQEYPLYEGRNVIGRFADRPVDIDLVAQEAEGQVWSSRQHAAITFDRSHMLIEDLNSLNGTWVNGARIYPGQLRPLKPNDVIQIGTVQLKVVVG